MRIYSIGGADRINQRAWSMGAARRVQDRGCLACAGRGTPYLMRKRVYAADRRKYVRGHSNGRREERASCRAAGARDHGKVADETPAVRAQMPGAMQGTRSADCYR